MCECTHGRGHTHCSATSEKLVARSECYLHKRDKTRSTIWRSIKVTDSAGPSPWRPGEFVRARQPALVIPDNVKCPLSLYPRQPLPAPPPWSFYRRRTSYPPPPAPLTLPPSPQPPPTTPPTTLLFAADGNRIFPPQNKPCPLSLYLALSLSLSPSEHTHTLTSITVGIHVGVYTHRYRRPADPSRRTYYRHGKRWPALLQEGNRNPSKKREKTLFNLIK